ncbi:HERV-H LTR-associating protein 2 [Ascaphus truei]|uniref:HERV-H LTR-associating protein 2 n=1 Tax=Ascaphus truei TaxID=8439 RepID=UPI003F59D8CC
MTQKRQEYICNIIFICVMLFHGSAVRGQTIIWGELSKEVILPCSFKPNKEEVIHWRTEIGKLIVHKYYKGRDRLEQQDQSYQNRTSLFLSELSNGNASLLLRDLQKSDGQSYHCYVGTNGQKEEYTVKLNIAAFEQQSMEYESKNNETSLRCSVNNTYPSDAVSITWRLGNRTVQEMKRPESYMTITNSMNAHQCVIHHSILNRNWTGTWEMKELNLTEGSSITLGCELCQTLKTNYTVTLLLRNNYSQQTELASMTNSNTLKTAENYKQRINAVNGKPQFVLKDLKVEDSGVYMCNIVSTTACLFM